MNGSLIGSVAGPTYGREKKPWGKHTMADPSYGTLGAGLPVRGQI